MAKKSTTKKSASTKKSSSKSKSIIVKDAKGKEHKVKAGSKADLKYAAEREQAAQKNVASAPKTSSSRLDIITDPVTKQTFARDTSDASSTYKSYTAPTPTTAPPAPPTQEPNLDVITDPVTQKQFARDTTKADSVYEAYTPPTYTPPPSQAPEEAAQEPPPEEQQQYVPSAQSTPAASAAPARNAAAVVPQTQAAQANYKGGSIVDFLNQTGQKSDFASRAELARQYGIQGYTGTAQQNTQLLNTLRGGGAPQVDTTPSTAVVPPAATTSTGVPTSSTPESLLASYGYALTNSADMAFKMTPAKSFQEVYNGVYDSIGLGDVKKNIDKTMQAITKLDDELAEKIADVNENPWLTEGVRVSQIRKLEERYDLKRAPYAANLTTLQDLYNNGREEARYVATATLNQYNQERQFQMDQIQAWQDSAEKLYNAQYNLLKDSADAAYRERDFQFRVADAESDRAYQQEQLSISRYNAETSRISATKANKVSQAEQSQAALVALGNTFSPGVRMTDGTPAVDANGFITPVAWKAALAQAPSLGLTRATIIGQFGSQLYNANGVIPSSYGLTPVEQKLITGK